jgi:hypothetical protein
LATGAPGYAVGSYPDAGTQEPSEEKA